jgi:hypothetical protein
MKKIREKIESSSPPSQEPLEQDADGQSDKEPLCKPSTLLLSKAGWEQKAGAAIQSGPLHSSRYDTLMRFAAVELEGTIKKEQPNG